MGFLTTLLTGFALSMDAFAVSVTKGMTLRKINILISQEFQALMLLRDNPNNKYIFREEN